jgi:multidrug efflux pump subunit AcrA (membrane-fusion protein)
MAGAQIPYPTPDGEMLLFESTAAARVVEKVRAATPGVVVEIFVKSGETVQKNQILGHTELDATKLQLDLAKRLRDTKSNVEAALSQAEAWSVTRQETEEAVRKRDINKSRLDWAAAMEKMYQANYQAQLEAESVQEIHYQYWKRQYENRFFRAPAAGVVSAVVAEVGKPVNYATHLFTISNEDTYTLPISVPAPLAKSVVPNDRLPIRSADGKSVNRALVDSVSDDPRATGAKIIRLLVQAADFPATLRPKLTGMRFDVLLPQVAGDTSKY